MSSSTVFTLFVLLLSLSYEASGSSNLTDEWANDTMFDCLLGWAFGEAPTDAIVEAYSVRPGIREPYANLNKIEFSDDLVDMDTAHLNPKLPFKFLMNGYNQNGPVNTTWMYKVAQTLVESQQVDDVALQKYNYVIIYWIIPGLSAEDLVNAFIYYLRTMSKYKQVLSRAAALIDRMIRDRENELIASGDGSKLTSYFNKFQFYGHSLGGQMVYHLAQLLHRGRPQIKFGKIIGLDPSLLCFKPGQYGINGLEGRKFANDVMVVHSSSGLIGVPESPGSSEIVLNGGTFQPNCSMTEITCHHSRSWEILNYFDATCQMVAYSCQSLSRFKSGSCFHSGANDKLFKLVNLAEQHNSKPLVMPQSSSFSGESYKIEEELNSALNHLTSSYLNETVIQQSNEDLSRFYYVNTAPVRHDGERSHCLQHYQAKLVILGHNSTMDDKCKITSFSGKSTSDRLSLTLTYATPDDQGTLSRGDTEQRRLEFGELVPGKLFTSLISYSGRRTLFTRAVVENIDLKGWAECLSNRKIHGNYTFMLDISFMSHMAPEVRRSFSTVLCERWTPGSGAGSGWKQLELTVCNRTRLLGAEDYLDSQLVVGGQQRNDPWYIQMLNALSQTILSWNPLAR